MAQFMIRFLISSLFISVMTLLLLAARRLCGRCLTSRMRYRLWFLFLGLLAVPLLPAGSVNIRHMFSWIGQQPDTSDSGQLQTFRPAPHQTDTLARMNDFGTAVSERTPSFIWLALFFLWIAGIVCMTVYTAISALRFYSVKKSALPLQNAAISRLYRDCLSQTHLKKSIPIYSTAFLKSPVIAGVFRPCIYIPIHIISGCDPKDLRYMLLHELQHYRHKDSLAGVFMNLAGILYWFHPFVWYALKEMKNDRETACDSSVLDLLESGSYVDYGNSLIRFAEKVSLFRFPFATGMAGSMTQMQYRILNIAGYRKPSAGRRLLSLTACILTALVLAGFVPLLATESSDQTHYDFDARRHRVISLDLSDVLETSSGSSAPGHTHDPGRSCFVLYDTSSDTWQIYNEEYATMRISPCSTYKIYSALYALEAGIITPEQSLIPWNGQYYPYGQWNADQTLAPAMHNSVTWYFQTLDARAGLPAIREFLEDINYGNMQTGSSVSTYWADGTLAISAVEQVELLRRFYNNEFEFQPEHIETVKDSLRLHTTANGTVYGKTGTGILNGTHHTGWFTGFVEQKDNVWFFALNIQNTTDAAGAVAAELTLDILSDRGICRHMDKRTKI